MWLCHAYVAMHTVFAMLTVVRLKVYQGNRKPNTVAVTLESG